MGFHVVLRGKAWGVRRSGAARCRTVGLSVDAAWKEACRLAERDGSVAYLHTTDGRIIARNNYGATE